MDRQKRWTIPDLHDAAGELASRLKTSPLIAQILLNRGISTPDACQSFLRPNLKELHEPSRIAGMTRAADRIAKAVRDGEKIVIYGDYDVDGITATSILWHAIRQLGGTVDFYIPHRVDEGYGLNAAAIGQICDEGAKLIVTVDCGVTAIEPAAIARDRGVDLIITDHHEWKSGDDDAPLLPECFAIVHPRLGGNDYPNPHLCGAGVSFKLAWAVGQAAGGAARVSAEFKEFLLEATALAALGTIADVVPLVGENRVLAHFGLSGLKQSRLTGIKALIASAALTGQNLDIYHVGFLLAPRLNACGRMGHARLAVDMLTTTDDKKATDIATYLEQQNRARQGMEKSILTKALAQAEELKMDQPGSRAIVLGDVGWHAGVIGIVASRIVDRFHRPAVMVALGDDGLGQGSGRSIGGFHLAQALAACGEHLEAHGGHEMAAGLKVRAEKFEDFRHAFVEHAARAIRPEMLVPELRLECVAELQHVTQSLVSDLQRLGPFGIGNRKPLLCCRGLKLVGEPRRVGKSGDHLQLTVRQGDRSMKCIAFNYGKLFDRLQPGIEIDLAVEPSINEYMGRSSVELQVKDLQFATVDQGDATLA